MGNERILLTGVTGQLGQALNQSLKQYDLIPMGRGELDFTRLESIRSIVNQIQPDIVVNAAAYTNVDGAEEEPELADRVNHLAVAELAKGCVDVEARLIHFSTDYVFDGKSQVPYKVTDNCHPINCYGQSKRKAEEAIQRLLPSSIVIRTSWLYSPWGHNFVKTMLKLMAHREQLQVVSDQMGSPTSVWSVVTLVEKIIGQPAISGIFHWSDSGGISWFDFATAIYQQAINTSLLEKAVQIIPVNAVDYPTKSVRPAYSVLDVQQAERQFQIPQRDWRSELNKVLLSLCSS